MAAARLLAQAGANKQAANKVRSGAVERPSERRNRRTAEPPNRQSVEASSLARWRRCGHCHHSLIPQPGNELVRSAVKVVILVTAERWPSAPPQAQPPQPPAEQPPTTTTRYNHPSRE